jgi:cytochrome c oxidase assembly factor CtaG
VLLAVLGTARTHQQYFTVFLVAVIGLSVLAVVVFVLTAPREVPRSKVDSGEP